MSLESLHSADEALNAAAPAPFPLPLGRLAPVVAGSLAALSAKDWWVPGLRERVGAVLRDVPLDKLDDPWAGHRPYRVAPVSPTPANRALYAVGLAHADRERAALVHLGIGSTADGAFHEALNLAALLRPTVIFVVAVDPLGPGAPLGTQLAVEPAVLAKAFGLTTQTVDGTSADAVQKAVATALEARGPHLVQANLETPS